MASLPGSTLVPFSQLELCRQRKSLGDALQARDWCSIQDLDQRLIESVDAAADDADRDMGSLLKELKVVVALYREILRECGDTVNEIRDQTPL